jgi:hypothetical protein
MSKMLKTATYYETSFLVEDRAFLVTTLLLVIAFLNSNEVSANWLLIDIIYIKITDILCC